MTATISILVVGVAVLLFLLVKRSIALKRLEYQFKDVIDIDKEVAIKNEELKKVENNIVNLKNEHERQKQQLSQEYTGKRNIYENLLKEISIVEEDLEAISYGLYKPHYDYKTPEEYKQKLEEIWKKEKLLIRNGGATYCRTQWHVNNSIVEGRKMTKHYSKLMLRAFNGECDGAISTVRWYNIVTREMRINKALEAINRLGAVHNISITRNYADLKRQELRLEFEMKEKLYQEREEQRKIREQIREEEKVRLEIEKAKREAEQQEIIYQKALQKARAELLIASGTDLIILNEKIKTLEQNLKIALEQKARAISRAQETKSGVVYIISNIGSFGENVYKIGMTRRLEPQDRIDELGNASVPYNFDVHGLIYTENAPELENKLHKALNERRVNLVRRRREFFNATIEEIAQIVKEFNLELQLTKLAEAKEYRMTLSIKEAKAKEIAYKLDDVVINQLEKFPETL